MKYLIYPLIIFQFAISFETYSDVIKKNKNDIQRWEPIKDNSGDNYRGNIQWEILEKNHNNNISDYLKWEIVPQKGNNYKILEDKKKQ